MIHGTRGARCSLPCWHSSSRFRGSPSYSLRRSVSTLESCFADNCESRLELEQILVRHGRGCGSGDRSSLQGVQGARSRLSSGHDLVFRILISLAFVAMGGVFASAWGDNYPIKCIYNGATFPIL